MSFKNDNELLNDFSTTRNLKQITKETYNYSIQLYTEFHGLSFVTLLEEAETEEDEGIRWKYRSIKRRLLSFRNHLAQHYMKNYVKSTFSRIITLYKHYEIEVHELPPLNNKNQLESPPISYADLPDKEIIKKALRRSDSEMKAIILFMTSSGSARRETLNLTINDFINATKDYHDSNDIHEIIKLLERRNDIIPTWKLKRQKTNKYYYTFNSPESTKQMIRHLKTKENLKNDDKIFDINIQTFTKRFIKINNQLKLGKKGTYNRFRSHMLRKYHASSLKNSGMTIEDINSLQGKTRNSTDESYFFDNPDKLKETYIEHLPSVTILSNRSKRKIKSSEVIKLEIENKKLKNTIQKLNNKIKELES